MQTPPEPSTHARDVLIGPRAETVLRTVLDAVGVTMHRWSLRSVHHRGAATLSTVYEVAVTDARGRDRDLLYVAHVSDRPVPQGAAQVQVGEDVVHLWQFPDDPFLPALRPAVHRGRAARHVASLGLPDGHVAIRTASYRPSRRAVVVLSDAAGTPLLFRKLLGGRTEQRRRERTAALVAAHDVLGAAVPVPRVLGHDPVGAVDLAALPGLTLRTVLLDGHELPAPADVAALLTALAAAPTDALAGDPAGYADVTRHLPSLRSLAGEQTARLDRLAEDVVAIGGPVGAVHGDLHDGQLLVDEHGELRGLLDVDGAGRGPRALDAGRLVAHVDAAARLAPPARRHLVTAWAGELRSIALTSIPRRDLALAEAAAWIGLATGPVRARGDGWRTEARARLERGLDRHAAATD